MNFNNHFELKDKHAFLSASSNTWLRYDSERLEQVYLNNLAKNMGTRLHAFAAECISLRQKLPKSNKTLNMYVNDCIGFRMETEQVLFYSYNCFGTADAISFRKNELRIFDLKTGSTPASMAQLMVYAALFCLEYKYNPNDILIHLRIYQNDEVFILEPTGEEIKEIMDKIIESDKIIDKIKMETNI